MIRQEHATWITATELVRAATRQAARRAAPARKGRRAGQAFSPVSSPVTRVVPFPNGQRVATLGSPKPTPTRPALAALDRHIDDYTARARFKPTD